jgi:hypothetical protein
MPLGNKAAGLATLAGTYLLLVSGCSQHPLGVELPSVDASRAASFAMERYDTNHDGGIVAAELASCRPLVAVISRYDTDRSGAISAEEIEARLTQLYGMGAALTSADCTVTLNGRPLEGAIVKFLPVEMLESWVKTSQGVTDTSGRARLALNDEDLPEDLRGTALVYPGLYYVDITHPKLDLPARYNNATELGFEVDPSLRDGTSARFDVRSK